MKIKIMGLIIVGIFLVSLNATAVSLTQDSAVQNIDDFYEFFDENKMIFSNGEKTDFDPLVDINITVTIKEIRALDRIDFLGKPDFYVRVYVDDMMHQSKVWKNKEIVNANWPTTFNVDDTVEIHNISIELWDDNPLRDRICDLDDNYDYFQEAKTIELSYSIKTGHWTGDDFTSPYPSWEDYSGYGRANGCDDNTIYQSDRDCVLTFDITQNDADGDGIPWWTEDEVYKTDPLVDNRGEDFDEDGVPIEWEHKWGNSLRQRGNEGKWFYYWIYDPNTYENHNTLDDDRDGLSNYEEYLVSEWGSDPFRKDIFVEVDQMEEGPDDEPSSILTQLTKDTLCAPFHKQNIVLHLDDGCMGGGNWLPFEKLTDRDRLVELYNEHFLQGNPNHWRKGVFHYGMVVYDGTYRGFAFGTDDDYHGAFQISSSLIDKRKIIDTPRRTAQVYASVYMHELGHTLDIQIPGGHDDESKYIWQLNWWRWRPYKSCMNYGYTYGLIDYSDGSRGRNDHDDWGTLDLEYFQFEVE